MAVVVGADPSTSPGTFNITTSTLTLQNAGGTTVTSGPKQILTVSGSGYLPGATITFKLDGTTTLGTATADASGNIPANTHVTIPSATNVAAHTIVATDTAGNTATANYTVVAPTITPASATVAKNSGSYTIASSSGFAPSAPFTVAFSASSNAGYGGLSPTSGTTTAGGAITPTTYTFNTPSGANKTGTLVFTDSFGNTASVALTT